MRAKMGNEFPKMGNKLPLPTQETPGMCYEAIVAMAIRRELGGSHQAIKTLMKRTGASSRTVKHWLAGTTGPNGAHLVELMRHSDCVFEAVVRLAGREQALATLKVAEAREMLRRADILLGDTA